MRVVFRFFDDAANELSNTLTNQETRAVVLDLRVLLAMDVTRVHVTELEGDPEL